MKISSIKKAAGIITVLILLVSFGSQKIFAQSSIGGNLSDTGSSVGGNPGSSGGTFGLQNPLSTKYDSVGGLVKGFMEYFSYLVIILAVLALIFTGLQFVLAQGKPDKMTDLKKKLGWILVGVAIVLGARLLVNVVINTLAGVGISADVTNSAKDALK